MNSSLSPVYSPWPLSVARAEGMKIYTDKGVFLDAFSGIGVLPLGHGHPAVLRAIGEKAARYVHLSNYFQDPDGLSVAESLTAMTGRAGEVYFSNSGAEANEAALKAIKKHRKGAIVSFEGNFHGRTLGSLSVTWGPAIRKPFEPLIPGCVFLPPRGEALMDFARGNDVAAVFLECVQGNSGVHPMADGLAEAVKELRRERGVLVVADEIQGGLGRTGRNFSYMHWGLEPDIVTVGKGVGGGLPLGAAVFCGWSPFGSGDHGSTFAPNPLSLAAGKATLSFITPEFVEAVSQNGERFMKALAGLPWAEGVRGRGLMIGVAIKDASAVQRAAFDRGVLLNVAGGAVRFLPSLSASADELDELAERLNF